MRERFRLFEQELGQKIWTIVQLFYRSHGVFKEQFESYEMKVLEYSAETGIHRKDLRLKSAQLAGLLDLKKLERLRDGYIQELKDLCHLVFRGQDRTDLLDRYVSDIFHEISILKEEHYNVQTYATLYERDRAEVELKHILDEAHTIFPEKLRHIRYLFGRAEARLEAHLSSFRNIQLFTRSLYLHRNDFVAESYRDGIRQFYRFMYPGGPVEGFYQVGVSFLHSGFPENALEAFLLAEDAYRHELGRAAEGGVIASRESREGVRSILRSARWKVRRLAAVCLAPVAASGPAAP
ncbi:MAG TPA: hypothetical protein VMT52_19735 [Planctomycetota bacterium]|nr:hypothetical protein [Planctomycetota bacterium]